MDWTYLTIGVITLPLEISGDLIDLIKRVTEKIKIDLMETP